MYYKVVWCSDLLYVVVYSLWYIPVVLNVDSIKCTWYVVLSVHVPGGIAGARKIHITNIFIA